MDKSSDINKRAVVYSFLAHINNSSILSNGPLDVFVPIVKKGLHIMTTNGDFKGGNISEIISLINELYDLEIPSYTLRNILKIISKEINTEEEKIFVLNNDDSFWIKQYVFEDYDQDLRRCKKDIDNLQHLFKEFCRINNVTTHDSCLVKFIEKNKVSISHYLANKPILNGHDYTIEAKFVEFFRNCSSSVYEQIKQIYLGAILTNHLDYSYTNIKIDVDLLFDTNFIISLLDLNTPESTLTCNKLIEIGKSLGYTFHVLVDTIEEAQGLLKYKAENFNKSIVQRFVNREDIYNACHRLNYTKTDLYRIADNLEKLLGDFNIIIVPNTDSIRNKARYSKEYQTLKSFRNSQKSALHDAMCIQYVRNKRCDKKIVDFEKVNCWWVNNAISHDFETDGITTFIDGGCKIQSEIIKVDDLLNILWLSTPQNNVIRNDEILDMGLTSLVAYTLNQGLPKSRIIKELDDNIQKYKNKDITDKDIYLLSTRIANGQIKNIEKLNELAYSDVERFNQGVKQEAIKQDKIEQDRARMLEKVVAKLNKEISEIQEHKVKLDNSIDAKIKEQIEESRLKHLFETEKKDIEINSYKEEINKGRKEKRERHIDKKLFIWRLKTWVPFLLVFSGIILIIILQQKEEYKDYINLFLENKILYWIVISIVQFFCLKNLYDKHFNHSNINAYISKIEIPEDMKNI